MTSCTWDYVTSTPANKSYTLMLCCFVFFIPLGIISYCYLCMFLAIRNTSRWVINEGSVANLSHNVSSWPEYMSDCCWQQDSMNTDSVMGWGCISPTVNWPCIDFFKKTSMMITVVVVRHSDVISRSGFINLKVVTPQWAVWNSNGVTVLFHYMNIIYVY